MGANLMGIPISPIKNNSWGGIYSRLEKEMKDRGVDIIGEADYRESNADKYKDKNGEVRPTSLNMSSETRAIRTLMVRRMNNEQLERLHRYEQLLGDFVPDIHIFSRRVLRMSFEPEILTEERLQALKDLNNAHRPDIGTIYGCKIMAYFPPDMRFDGMLYNMEWDRKVMYAEFTLPDIKVKSKAKVKSYLGEI